MMQIMTCVAETSVDGAAIGEGNMARIGDGSALFSGLEGSRGPTTTTRTLCLVHRGHSLQRKGR